jgi:hypothetical protein
MNLRISADTTTLYWRLNGEVPKIEPWGQTACVCAQLTCATFPPFPARWYRPQQGSNLSRVEVCFRTNAGERIFWHMMGDCAMDPRDWPDPASG